jgi:hypothetical protein
MMGAKLLGLSYGAGMPAVLLVVVVGLKVAVSCERTVHGITSSRTSMSGLRILYRDDTLYVSLIYHVQD